MYRVKVTKNKTHALVSENGTAHLQLTSLPTSLRLSRSASLTGHRPLQTKVTYGIEFTYRYYYCAPFTPVGYNNPGSSV